MRRSHCGESFERVNHLLVGDHTAAEPLAQNRFESDGIDVIRAADDAIALQRGQGLVNHHRIVGHPLVTTFGNHLSAVLVHAEKPVFE